MAAVTRFLGRLLIGGLFIGHGTQKLFGWFGGGGLEETAEMFESIGLRPGRRQAQLAGTSEAFGGALLALGLATPAAGAALSGVMLAAIRTVHWPKGPWATNGGYEYNAVMLTALFWLVEHGPGPISLDAALGKERAGTRWALAALGAGALGSAAAVAAGRAYVQNEAADESEDLIGSLAPAL